MRTDQQRGRSVRVDVQQRGIADEEASTQCCDYAARRLRLALGRLAGVVQRAKIRLVDLNSAAGYLPGRLQPRLGKRPIDAYLEVARWNARSPAPEVPAGVVPKTAASYREVLERLTGADKRRKKTA